MVIVDMVQVWFESLHRLGYALVPGGVVDSTIEVIHSRRVSIETVSSLPR
jgi:hypothetical protein